MPFHRMLVRLRNVEKKFGSQYVLKGASLEIEEGENRVIIGRSGSGKSVILKHIMGLLRPDSGEIWFRSHNIASMQEREITPLRHEMGMLFQSGALFDSLNVAQNVGFSLREVEHLPDDEVSARVQQALEMVDLPSHGRKMPSELSGGMRKRVALARAIIGKPKLMLYDEPTTGLDPIVADSINKLIVRLSSQLEMTTIIVTHDMTSAYHIANRISLLHEGKIYCTATPQEIQSSEDPIISNFVKGVSTEKDVEPHSL